MRTIHKFDLQVDDEIIARMPQGSELLTVQVQRGVPRLWALVDDTRPMVKRRLAMRGTGHGCEGLAGGMFVGTFQLADGNLIMHVFDRGEQ